ncbi:MAG: hypothetical protein DI535_22815 [Citrobacter freundii]|nr:MAG: hypothetical protein DI535_22815 [Citrobacter freundii]
MQPNFADHLLQTLSWTFIHSLWLGLILSVIAGLIMLFTARSAASVRYALLAGSYFLFLSALIICFYIEWNTFDNESVKIIVPGANKNVGIFRQLWLQQALNGITGFLNTNSFWIVSIWTTVISVKAVKMLLDLMYVSRMRSRELYSPGEEWTRRVQELTQSIGIKKKVSLAESALVKVPLVIGHLKPLILMPVGIVSKLSAAEVEAVLLHELAHIRRHDYLVNFIQRLMETLLFFNPALLWVSSLMRIEREHCCDDIAIGKTDNPLQFAEALISFKEYSMKPQHYALGLFGRKSLLLQRMTRIVYKRNKTLSPFEFIFFTANLVLFCLLLLGKGRHTDNIDKTNGSGGFYIESSSTVAFADLRRIKTSVKKEPIEKPFSIKNDPVKNTGGHFEAIDGEKKETDEQAVTENRAIADAIVKQQTKYSDDLQQYEAHRLQAEHDREVAEMERAAAEKDRMRAAEDRARAEIDRARAAKDREQAEKDRQQADRDRERAEKDRELAEKDRMAAEIRRKKADEERKQITLATPQP